MALITRVSRLFRADIHAVLDRIEEPDLLLRQALREMEASFANDEQQFKLLKHEVAHLESRNHELEQTLEEIDDELDICFSSQQEDLARAVIRKKLEAQRRLKLNRVKQTTTEQSFRSLEQRLEEQRPQLENMRQKTELLTNNLDQPGNEHDRYTHEVTIWDDEVEIALLKEKQRRSQQ
ncbi:MAG: hypothetical protein GY696_38275 [Gammaproteobacteria bacterium]|nr:hypothetical protein [Gammaproteobacteria bacterium]